MNIIATQIAGRAGPIPVLDITVSSEWQREPAFFLSLTGHAEYATVVVSDSVQLQISYWPNAMSTLITRDRSWQGKLIVPMRNEAVRYIEEHRRDQDVVLNLNLRYTWQSAVTFSEANTGSKRTVAGEVYSDTISVQGCVIKRSDWLKRLTEMKWQEYELFEVATQPLLSDKNLTVALERLREAQTALRNGDYSGVLAKCRAAFESAAQYELPNNTKQGFDNLLARVFGADTNKPERLNDIIKTLSEYAHFGRHERYPTIRIGREEAEFVFSTTVSTFSLVSRLLARTP